MDLIAHFLNGRLVPNNQGFTKVWLFSFPTKRLVDWAEMLDVTLPFGVDSHELQFLPTPLHHILYA